MAQPSSYLSQHKVWDHRINNWDGFLFSSPLLPNDLEINFQKSLLVPNGKTLVLGVTQELVSMALTISSSVTCVDFVQGAIDKFAIEGATYVCQDWISYLQRSTEQYDNIITDNGLSSLEFTQEWPLLSSAVYDRLNNGGVFSPRVIIHANNELKEHYDNLSLLVMMPVITAVSKQTDWSVTKPGDDDMHPYDARYVFPSLDDVKDCFKNFELLGALNPEYEESEHFVTLAFKKSSKI